jgi:hypothetical protein
MFSGTSDNVILRALGVLQLTSVMRKSLTALTAATAIAAAAIATLTDARWRGAWWGPALGGFALGALFGSAFVRITVTGTAPITWLPGVLQLWLSAIRLRDRPYYGYYAARY